MNCLFCLKADRREELQEKDEADRLYHHVKREVENGLAYLQVLLLIATFFRDAHLF